VDLNGKKLVDIGSRLGTILYAAKLYNPDMRQAVGIEMNAAFVDIQHSVIASMGLSDIEVVCADFRNCTHVFADTHVVFMNNVFGFFLPADEQVNCWQTLRKILRSGTYLIHNPSIDSVTSQLPLGFVVSEWLQQIATEVDEDRQICVYRIV
jgi:predicted RNA methylase